jgi:hypothetical protein
MTVDELVVELRLDPSHFTAGEKEALDSFRKTEDEMTKRLKNLEASTKNVGYSFGGITTAAEGLFTVLAGAGMAAFARDTMTSVAATGRMATNIGVATAELSAFGRMIERNGGNAESAIGSMKGLADQVTRLNTFGEGSPELFKFLGIIGAKEGDNPLETFMKFAEWAEKNRDNPQLVNIIGQSGGLDQGAINEAMKGHAQVMRDYQAALKGAIDPAQVAALTRLQDAWVGLDQAIEKTGRDIVTDVAPAFTSVMTGTTAWIERNQKLADSLGEIMTAIAGLAALKPAAWVLRLLGLGAVIDVPAAAVATGAGIVGAPALGVVIAMTPTEANAGEQNIYENGKLTEYGRKITGQSGGGGGGDVGQTGQAGQRAGAMERETWIRAKAAELNIDPEVAMHVSRSEGFKQFSGDNNTSFGDFQLHITPGGRGHAVGDEFQKQTGLDPSDPANERRSDEYALDWVKRHGWGDFHGAANSGIGSHQGIGDINVTVNTESKSPREHGRIVADEVKKSLSVGIATQANTGLN